MIKYFEVEGVKNTDSNKIIDEAINIFLNARVAGSNFGQTTLRTGEELFVKYSKGFGKIKISKGDVVVTPAGFVDIDSDDYEYIIDIFISAFENEYGEEDLKWQLENIREEFIFTLGYVWWALKAKDANLSVTWLLNKRDTETLLKKSAKFLSEIMAKAEDYIRERLR